MRAREDAGRGLSEDLVTIGGGVEVIPEEVSVWIYRVSALGTGSHICQRITGGRRNYFVEQRKHIQLMETKPFAKVEIVQQSEAGLEEIVIDKACRSRGNRRRGAAVEPGNQS